VGTILGFHIEANTLKDFIYTTVGLFVHYSGVEYLQYEGGMTPSTTFIVPPRAWFRVAKLEVQEVAGLNLLFIRGDRISSPPVFRSQRKLRNEIQEFFGKETNMLRRILAIIFFIAFGLSALLSGIAGNDKNGGFKSWAVMFGIAMAFAIIGIALWPFKKTNKSQTVEWNTGTCPQCGGEKCHRKAVSTAWTDFCCPDCGYNNRSFTGFAKI